MGITKKSFKPNEEQQDSDMENVSLPPSPQSVTSDSSNISMSSSESETEDDSDEETMQAGDEDADGEDVVVKAIRLEKEKKRNHPADIIIEDSITDISFHPIADILAISTDVGDVLIYKHNDEEHQLCDTYELHTRASRVVEFSLDGTSVFSAGKDKAIMVSDTETGKLKLCYDYAHDDAIYSLKMICDNTFVTGDDSGVVRIWDIRVKHKQYVCNLKLGDDYISDFVTTESQRYLACAGGDGTLSSIDLNTRKIHITSEEYDSELTCLGLFRGETKLLVGSTKGKLYLFNWGEFGLHSDEYSGRKQAISCMVPITENIVVTSGEDGVLRAAHMFPHRQLGVVGQHNLPVEKMDINNNGHLIASTTLQDTVKFWNVGYFENIEKVINLDQKQNKRRDMSNNLPSSKKRNASDFFFGLV